MQRRPLIPSRLASVRHEAQLAAGRAFPRIQAQLRKNLFLPESFAREAPHRESLALWAKRVRIDAALVSEFTRGHWGVSFHHLAARPEQNEAPRSQRGPLKAQFKREVDSFSCSRRSPRIASPAMARANVRDALSDSGRSSRIPNPLAYSLKAMSTS